MSKADNTTKDWRDETSTWSRKLAGLVRRVAVNMTQGTTWQAIGHILLDGNKETLDAEVFPGIGFWSRPAADANAEAIVAFPGGPANPAIVATRDEALRKKMVQGDGNQDETYLFNSRVVLRFSNSGLIQAYLLGGPVPVPLALKSDVDGAITAHNGHTHTDPQGGVTGPPNTTAPASVGSSVLRG
jgi:hypothetical protein